jgi:hypothetical protein
LSLSCSAPFGAYGTLGAIKEGNNANVIGIRQRF